MFEEVRHFRQVHFVRMSFVVKQNEGANPRDMRVGSWYGCPLSNRSKPESFQQRNGRRGYDSGGIWRGHGSFENRERPEN